MSRQIAASEDDPLRDVKMKKWHLRKELFDKGLEINVKRAEEEDSLKEVAIAAAAIDRMIGDDEPGQKEQSQTKPKKKTMKSVWQKWTMENHSFSMVQLSDEEVKPFTGAVKENLQTDENGVQIYASLKYNFPGVPKPGEKAKPVTNDQRLLNLIFMKECGKVWRAAKEEMRQRVLEAVGVAQQRGMKGHRSGSDYQDQESIVASAERRCLTKLSIMRLKQWVEDDEDERVKKLKEDEMEKNEEKKISHNNFVRHKDSLRIRLPPQDFDAAVIAGGKARPKSAGPKMSFGGSNATNPVRKKDNVVSQTTVELMAGSGLKYVHATSKGRQGMEGDLEKSRKLLMSKGFISKSNFDGDEEFKKMARNNPTVIELKKQREKEIEDSNRAFEEWSVLKSNREQAMKALALVPPPNMEFNDDPSRIVDASAVAPNCTLSREQLENCIEIGQLLKRVDRTLFTEWFTWANSDPAALARVKNPVDAQKAISFNFATTLWDFFEPRACDMHSAISSQVRETFQKLLRPGLDFRAAFLGYAGKLWNRQQAKNAVELSREEIAEIRSQFGSEPPQVQQEEMNKYLATKTKEERDKTIACMALSRKDMKNLFADMGITMKKNEMNALIDAFDANGDGVVTLVEFLEFTGPMRDKNSGVVTTLKNKCCWRTTCQKTGMPNAYAVSDPTKDQLRREGKNVIDDAPGGDTGRLSKQQEKLSGEKTEIIRLKNGETRVRVELAERKKREDLLIRYRLLHPESSAKNTAEKVAPRRKVEEEENEGDDYGSDFDEEAEGKKGDKKKDDKKKQKDLLRRYKLLNPEIGVEPDEDNYDEDFEDEGDDAPSCAYCKWSMEERQRAIRRLTTITKDARQEEQLKAMIADGSPPSAPRLWAAGLNDDDVDDNEDALTTSLLVRWAPGDPANDLVSFYSLEYAGMVRSVSTGERIYKEIYRDPNDADINTTFSLKFWQTNLEPGCSYAFRIRAFNGYGPSSFGYKVFTTRPAAPSPPRVISCAHDAVTLRWVFSNIFLFQMQQLQKFFEMADKDHSGEVSREELALIFSDKVESNPDLMKMIKKVLVKKGIDPSVGIVGLFDQIEGDDDNALSWGEFEKFFVEAGFTNESMGASKMMAASGVRGSMVSTSRNDKKQSLSDSNKADTTVSYVVEQCESELMDIYKECMKSSVGQCTITRLEPGHTYRFRVYGVNVDGSAGPKSETVIVHTMLEPPPPPKVQGTNVVPPGVTDKLYINPCVQPNKVMLKWRGRRDGVSSRDKGVVNRILGDWAGSGNDDNGFDLSLGSCRDKNGFIEPAEFANLLQDLGVECTEERFTAAFREFDSNDDGVISFTEFSKWWRKDEVSYNLKRSDVIPPTLPVSLGATADTEQSKLRSTVLDKTQNRSKTPMRMSKDIPVNKSTTVKAAPVTVPQQSINVAMPQVSYRGEDTQTDIAGLTPNSLYHFCIRYIGSRSNSTLSRPLVLMTTPIACEAPVLMFLSPTQVRIKWYPPKFGAHKFCVQLKNLTPSFLEGKKGDEFSIVFVGQENTWVSTTLIPDCNYAVRVVGINAQGMLGTPSAPLNFRTYPRGDTAHLYTPKNASATFHIECTGDVCVGDTILLTERLYAKSHGVGVVHETSGGVRIADTESFTSRNLTSRPLPNSSGNGMTRRGKTAGTVESGTSVYSLSTTGRGGHLLTGEAPEAGAFIGERVLAAHVVKDNYKSTRVELGEKDLQPGRFSKTRRLWLEVVWQKASSDACKPYELKPGMVVERTQAHIEQFEVFRCPWANEDARKSLREDLASMSECFLSYKC